MVKKYQCEIVSIVNPVSGVYTVEFFPIEGKFKYKPGQFLHLALDDYDPSGSWPESRCFSMQTSSQSQTLKITYAVKGLFTKKMEELLQVGKQIWIKLPYGDLFTQEHRVENTIFIAGGTGVTPYLSLFTDGSFANYQNPVLYLGCRSESYHFYEEELALAKRINPTLKCFYCYQEKDGMLDIEKILSENPNATSFFISGPPVMITNFRKYLLEKGIGEDRIKTDDWE